MVKWLATLFSQLDSLKPFPSTAQKGDSGSGALRNSLYTMESQSKSSWMSSGGRERRIWKAWEGIMCCWLRAPWWPGRKEATSAVTCAGRKEVETNTWTLLCARNSTHMLSLIHPEVSTRFPYDPRFTRILHPTSLSETGSSLPPEVALFTAGKAKKSLSALNSEHQPQHIMPQITCNRCSWSAECLWDVRITRGRHHWRREILPGVYVQIS